MKLRMIAQLVELSTEQMHGKGCIASLDGALQIVQRFVVLAQSRVNCREAQGRYVVGLRPRLQYSDFPLRFIAAPSHGITISYLAMQQRSALHLRGIGKMRDGVDEL